jgi:hypothetical protein
MCTTNPIRTALWLNWYSVKIYMRKILTKSEIQPARSGSRNSVTPYKKYSDYSLSQCPFVHQKSYMQLVMDRNRTSDLRSRWLSTTAMTFYCNKCITYDDTRYTLCNFLLMPKDLRKTHTARWHLFRRDNICGNTVGLHVVKYGVSKKRTPLKLDSAISDHCCALLLSTAKEIVTASRDSNWHTHLNR